MNDTGLMNVGWRESPFRFDSIFRFCPFFLNQTKMTKSVRSDTTGVKAAEEKAKPAVSKAASKGKKGNRPPPPSVGRPDWVFVVMRFAES